MGSRERVPPNSRRTRLCRRVRRRAEVSRDPALPGGPSLDEPHPLLRGRARARHAEVVLTAAPNELPLAGVRVLALEQAVAAPFCTRQLADLGADVIKIERPVEGDMARGYDGALRGVSTYFAWLNRGKRSIVLDLKDAGDLETCGRLIARADVFVHNL